MPPITTIISYCSLDAPFAVPLLAEASRFSKEIILVAADHLLDGAPEDLSQFSLLKEKFPHIQIIVQSWTPDKRPRHWHNAARWEGFIRAKNQWTLFLDGDEIPDGALMTAFLRECDFSLDGYAFRCYWYFREPVYRALTLSQCGLLIHGQNVTRELIFSESERAEFRNRGFRVREEILQDGVPIFHHFSWARPRELLLQKVRAWAHRDEGGRDWVGIVEREFEHPFLGTEEVHGFQYERVPNRFGIEL